MNKANNLKFDHLVDSLYDDGSLPPVAVVPNVENTKSYFRSTGMVPVLSEDESEECPVFDNWGTHYSFAAWAAYREMTHTGKAFQAMVTDVLDRLPWSPDVAAMVTRLDGLVNVHKEYEEKFKHAPADKAKMLKSYERYGRDTALLADRY